MENNKYIKELSIKGLFEEKNSYLIPIYQRSYAWGKSEVEQLVADINDYAKENENEDKEYYIGTLVVFQKNIDSKVVFETIDGQQRLTTLSILLSVLKNEFKDKLQDELIFNHLLKYESREISTSTISHIYSGDIEKQENLNFAMENAYKVLKNYLEKIDNLNKFKNYLLSKVKILRVNVPKDTDLNHYFEIMNSRGEQLEKHEVLKARMLSELTNKNDKKVFNDIWEACSDMYRYVHYGFKSDERDEIFGKDWNDFECSNFDGLVEIINPEENTESTSDGKKECSFTIDNIINDKCGAGYSGEDNNDKPDRFTSPISFPNFLLHVLKITNDRETPLDDKKLLEVFNENDGSFVKKFGYNLLKMRFLFDNYVIKREYTSDKDEWSLKQAHKYEYEKNKKKQISIQYKNRFQDEDKNKSILMILSMYHVSNPSQIYKYWLTGVLKYLSDNCMTGINANDYLIYLEKLAELFLKNRYLAEEPEEFEDIIFESKVINNNIEYSKLDKGTSVEHFVFNYLDYLLWKGNKNKFKYYNFSFSNSVEHFYPQSPIEGHKKMTNKNDLNSFGNLCLISVSKNAKLNNHPPQSKKAHYPNNQYDSLKQHIMMEKADNWNEDAIEEHREKMQIIFKLSHITNGVEVIYEATKKK